MTESSWIRVWVPSRERERESNEKKREKEEEEEESSNKETDSTIISEKKKTFQVTNVRESFLANDISVDSRPEDLFEKSYFEEIMTEYLTLVLNIQRYTKNYSPNDEYILFTFQVQSDSVEAILIELQKRGIGIDDLTSVSVVANNVSWGCIRDQNKESSNKEENSNIEKFYNSVKSRLMVAEVISRIRTGSNFTFDYFMLVLLAAVLAFLGLIENNSVVLVASMLVSPIMGPILAGIFGSVIRDYGLTYEGIKNEVRSLVMCIIIGLILGIILTILIQNGLYPANKWPTQEMISRGEVRGLVVGVLVAIPSGAGVALSVLGGNAGSLVGVAISASLLPPAVNAGTFWGIALVTAMKNGYHNDVIKGYNVMASEELHCDFNNESSHLETLKMDYSCDFAMNAFVWGWISLTLTVLNIICIIFTGFAILSLKEVTPDKIPQAFSTFWKRDIRAHRNYYKTLKKGEELEMTQKYSHDQDELDGTFLQKIFEKAHQDMDYLDITRWVAFPPPPKEKTIPNQNVDINLIKNEMHRDRSFTMNHFKPKRPAKLERQFSHT